MEYYIAHRPLSFGEGYPKEGVREVHNYGSPMYISKFGCRGWGYVAYDRELSMEERQEYGLSRAHFVGKWYPVLTIAWDDSTPMKGRTISSVKQPREAPRKPKDILRRLSRCTVSIEWYQSPEQAQRIADVLNWD